MYGIQTVMEGEKFSIMFENDVKMYGIQTASVIDMLTGEFENDVKMYGIQTENGSKPFG